MDAMTVEEIQEFVKDQVARAMWIDGSYASPREIVAAIVERWTEDVDNVRASLALKSLRDVRMHPNA